MPTRAENGDDTVHTGMLYMTRIGVLMKRCSTIILVLLLSGCHAQGAGKDEVDKYPPVIEIRRGVIDGGYHGLRRSVFSYLVDLHLNFCFARYRDYLVEIKCSEALVKAARTHTTRTKGKYI